MDEDEAKEGLSILAEKQEDDNKALQDNVEKNKQKGIDDAIAFKESLKKTIDETTEIAGIPIKKAEKVNFYNFLTQENKKGETAYAKAVADDPEADIKMAYFLYKKFSFKNIKQEAETKNAQKIRDGLDSYKKNSKGKNLKNKGSNAEDNNEEDEGKIDFKALSLSSMMAEQ